MKCAQPMIHSQQKEHDENYASHVGQSCFVHTESSLQIQSCSQAKGEQTLKAQASQANRGRCTVFKERGTTDKVYSLVTPPAPRNEGRQVVIMRL